MIAVSEIRYLADDCSKCGLCADACPVLRDRGESGADSVQSVVSDGCVTCGECLKACPGTGLDYDDDLQRFMSDLAAGLPISILAAPAVQRHFPDYRRLFGYLRSLGARSFHNVLLHADITLWAYVTIMRRNPGKPYLSSACTSITNHILQHRPSLRGHLLPIMSPLRCAAVYQKRYRRQSNRLAFISPCIAKRAETRMDGGEPLVHYSVTIGRLKRFIENRGVDLSQYDSLDFDDANEGNGQTLGFHGALNTSISEHLPGLTSATVEGAGNVYDYLDAFEARLKQGQGTPALLELYNCIGGCGNGTGTGGTPPPAHLLQKPAVKNTIERDAAALFRRYDQELHLEDFLWKQLLP